MAKIFIDDTYLGTPYKKKKHKKNKKSNHKHNFISYIGYENMDFLGKNSDKKHYFIFKECSICKKKQITNYFITCEIKNSNYRKMCSTLEDVKTVYPTLEIKEYKTEMES